MASDTHDPKSGAREETREDRIYREGLAWFLETKAEVEEDYAERDHLRGAARLLREGARAAAPVSQEQKDGQTPLYPCAMCGQPAAKIFTRHERGEPVAPPVDARQDESRERDRVALFQAGVHQQERAERYRVALQAIADFGGVGAESIAREALSPSGAATQETKP